MGSGGDRTKLQIHLTPTLIAGASQRGAFAWWVSGENQKARLPKPYEPSADNNGRWAINAKSHSVADPKSFGMEKLAGPMSLPRSKASASSKATYFPKPPTGRHRRNSSMISRHLGRPADQYRDRWLEEGPLALYGKLDEHHGQTGHRQPAALPREAGPGHPLQSSDDRQIPSLRSRCSIPGPHTGEAAAKSPIYQHGAVTSWENLKDYVLAYRTKNIAASASGRATIAPFSVAIDGDRFSFLHKVRVLPVIARIQWVLSHSAGPAVAVAGQAAPPAGSLEPRLLLTPVITMWNPYNVEMTFYQRAAEIQYSQAASSGAPIHGQWSREPHLQSSCRRQSSPDVPNHMPALSDASGFTYEITAIVHPQTRGNPRLQSACHAQPAGAILELAARLPQPGRPLLRHQGLMPAVPMRPERPPSRPNARFDTEYDDKAARVSASIST